jgi:hypothetical protein
MISKLIAVKLGPAAALPCPYPWVPPYDAANSPILVQKKNLIVSILPSKTLIAG